MLGFLALLVIAAIAGGIGQVLSGYSLGGFVASTMIGLVGAWLGIWLAGQLGLPAWLTLVIDGQPFPVVWAIVGATLLSFVFGLLSRRRY